MKLYPQPVQQTGIEYLPTDVPREEPDEYACDGWRIKTDRATSRIPVIALTVNVMAADREKVLAASGDDFDINRSSWQRLLGKIAALQS